MLNYLGEAKFLYLTEDKNSRESCFGWYHFKTAQVVMDWGNISEENSAETLVGSTQCYDPV